jgi:transcriptional regulator with XRE-family HTH domain
VEQRLGTVIRTLRRRRGWRQVDLARAAGVSRTTISRVEGGHGDQLTLATLRAIAEPLEARLDLVPRWRGAELDRLLNARHSALHEAVAQEFARSWPDWQLAPEASFSIYGERGVIDLLAWHAQRATVLVVELKTALVDVNEVLGTLDRKRRLAVRVAGERGWRASTVGTWLLFAEDRSTRRRIADHRTMLRSAAPAGGRAIRHWLRDPNGPIRAMSAWPMDKVGAARRDSRIRGARPSEDRAGGTEP